MKKSLIFLGSALAVGTGVLALGNEALYRFLIHKEIKVPSGFGKFMSGGMEKPTDKERLHKESRKYLDNYGYDRHYMVNDRGHKVVAYHVKPKKESKTYVFCSHGYRYEGKLEWCWYVNHYVEELGYNMFIVDHQCAGESEGEYIGFSSFESQDGMKWLGYMKETFGEDINIILHGMSMGSTTVMLMTGNENLPENVKFTIADCGFTSALDEFKYKLKCWGVPENPVVPILCAMNRARAGYDFQNDTNALEAVSGAKVPMLFVHGDADKFVPTYMVHELFDACSAPYKDKLVVPGAGHSDSYYLGREDYNRKIDEFVEKFI